MATYNWQMLLLKNLPLPQDSAMMAGVLDLYNQDLGPGNNIEQPPVMDIAGFFPNRTSSFNQ